MPERASARAPAARTAAAPLRAPSPETTSSSRRGAASGPSGPPVLRLVTGARAGEPRVRDDGVGELLASPGPGEPLAEPIRLRLESSLGVDLTSVRIHADKRTRTVVDRLGARAFTLGRRIFLSTGESASDLGLMAHEAAHVVQQQSAPRVQAAGGGGAPDALEHEAQRASAAVVNRQAASVVGRTSPRPQFAFGDFVKRGISAVGGAVGSAVSAVTDVVGDIAGMALDFIKNQARSIPGYDMLGFILQRDPITQQPVPRNAVNLIRAVMGLWPGGSLIFDALQAHGIIDKVANWLEPQFNTLRAVVGGIRRALDQFIATLGASDVLSLGKVWDRAKRIFSEPIDRASEFLRGLAGDVLTFIRDAILLPIAKLAEGTRGYDLLKAVLGKDPITGQPVPQDAMTLIGGFMKLIGEEEIFENMKTANALPRAWAWFQKALGELKLFVQQIPPTFIGALKALGVADMILIPRAYLKIGKVFADFVFKFISWAGGTVWNLLEIIFDVVSPGALEYIKKTGAALKSILKNPLPFVGNLVKAAKLGFENFADHIGTHLKAALLDWLLGALPGVYIPKALELGEIVKFVFSVLGLSWQNVRTKLVAVVGETAVKAMEIGFDIVVTLVTKGPAAAWEQIKGELVKLKDQVISGIIGLVVDTIVKKAVPKLIAMFIPGAGFITAIISIYDTIMVFVNKIAKIIQVVKGFIDSIVSIANGVIDAAAKRVESTLANLLSLAISFLAGFLGLGSIADKIMGVITNIRGMVDKALDALIKWIVTMAKKLFGKVKTAVSNWWKKTTTFKTGGKTATFYFEGEEDKARPFVKSSPGVPISEYLTNWKPTPTDTVKLGQAMTLALDLEKPRPASVDVETHGTNRIKLYDDLAKLLNELGGKSKAPPSIVTYSSIQAGVGGGGMEAKILSQDHQPGTKPAGETWPLWEALDPLISGPPNYVRGHLLNENVGGKGQIQNLTPITTKANAGHKTMVETAVKDWVNAGEVVYYKVDVEYGSVRKKSTDQQTLEAASTLTKTQQKKLAALDAERKLCRKFVFKAYVLEQKTPGATWTKDMKAKGTLAPIDDEVKNE